MVRAYAARCPTERPLFLRSDPSLRSNSSLPRKTLVLPFYARLTPRPHSTAVLRLLLAAIWLLPACLFVAVSYSSFRHALTDARRELQRTSEVAREQAERVFDGQSQVAERVSDLVRGMDAPAIRAAQAPLHQRMAEILTRLPQVQGVLVVDKAGQPMVSANTYPVPPGVNLSGRDFFRTIMGGYDGVYVSSLQRSAITGRMLFGLARPWRVDGRLAGVINVALSPGFFEDFYRMLVGEGGTGSEGKVLTLIREDGQMLVRYPPAGGLPLVAPANAPFYAAVRANREAGTFQARSIVDPDAPVRFYAYSKVAGYPLYVVAGRSRSVVVALWWRSMRDQLEWGVPALAALLVMTRLALRTARREEAALGLAHAEIDRRQAAEAALLQAQRLEAVGQLTGGVAHDFNNLLTVVLGRAEALERECAGMPRARQLAEQIGLAARHGSAVTQQLLTFSRQQMLHPVLVDLNARLQAFKPLLEQAAGVACQVDIELEPELGAVRLDPSHFEAAILNLVGNARDAMPQGGRILVRTRNHAAGPDASAGAAAGPDGQAADPAPGPFVCVCVTDSGLGMDALTAARAFEPFFTTKDVGRGTGLGLSQVYGFAKQAGGEARISSQPGHGTRVELLLPSTGAALDPEPAAETGAVPPDWSGDGLTVLVVEDDRDLRETVVDSLSEMGFAVLTAAHAEAALTQLAAPGRIDLLFSDVIMPGGTNGVELAKRAKTLRPDIRVLLTSGFAGGQGADLPLLAKPYDRAGLAAGLRGALA